MVHGTGRSLQAKEHRLLRPGLLETRYFVHHSMVEPLLEMNPAFGCQMLINFLSFQHSDFFEHDGPDSQTNFIVPKAVIVD